jgi:hypothetical protein
MSLEKECKVCGLVKSLSNFRLRQTKCNACLYQRKKHLSEVWESSRVTEKKICIVCQEDKPGSEFGRGFRRCKLCHNRLKGEYYEKNKDILKLGYRARAHGITVAELVALGDTCEICGCKPQGRAAYVDHCHATGRVRGLLCMHCNQMIGGCRDNTELLDKGRVYLEFHEAKAGIKAGRHAEMVQ